MFGDEESVEDLGASDIYVQMYGIVRYEVVVVCILDAGFLLKIFSITFPVGK